MSSLIIGPHAQFIILLSADGALVRAHLTRMDLHLIRSDPPGPLPGQVEILAASGKHARVKLVLANTLIK